MARYSAKSAGIGRETDSKWLRSADSIFHTPNSTPKSRRQAFARFVNQPPVPKTDEELPVSFGAMYRPAHVMVTVIVPGETARGEPAARRPPPRE
jgi:hypothetical protein